ncbi:non-structural maintenance of chromosomes element 4 homolog A isoform X1 [Zootermopsis nevadensis]|uniref:Non-structural maintenance of chromosomes element 4 n=1 Tax=Zootermopsis nevadensis TaxID=136037 RepID=A0A067QSC2_ZOONE|nr:non-structural maintenance of chromosomes element 4 homolog A isoform X1 [Zootermopsis nevadensis]KDR02398.1 Non-SMC element 4-like protein A [Zootermopsis nevadensis]
MINISVQNPEDALIDAKVVNASSTVLKRSAQALDTNLLSFTREEYYKNTLSYLQEESSVVRQGKLNFQKLASEAAECFSRTPSASYILGAFQVGEVACAKKKERKQRAKQEIERKSQPENVTCNKEEDDIEDSVHYIMNVLTAAYRQNKNKPICFFKLVINPDSFGATVENIFHVSFLVRDGYVNLSWDENRFPVIAPVPRNAIETKYEQQKRQMILGIDMKKWEELKKAFEIREAMIKPRSIDATQESSN